MAGISLALEAKITAPITWDAHPKFRIEDLRETHYDEVISLIKRHYFFEDPMCTSIGLLRDRVSRKAYLDLINVWIRDTTSLVAVSGKSGRVVGVAVIRINSSSERTNTYSRVQIIQGEALESIMHLKSSLVKQANAYEALGSDTILRIYVLVVHPSYKKHNVTEALLEACGPLALSLKIPVISGIFTFVENQVIAEKIGFSLLTEIKFNQWVVDDKIVFKDTENGNCSAAYMVMLTPDEETLKYIKKMKEKERRSLENKSDKK